MKTKRPKSAAATHRTLQARTRTAALQAAKARAEAEVVFHRAQKRLMAEMGRTERQYGIYRDRLISTAASRPLESDRFSTQTVRVLRRRLSKADARRLANDNYCAAALEKTWVFNTIGSGITIRSNDPVEAQAEAKNNKWERWTKRCDVHGRTFWQFQREFGREAYICGEVAALKLSDGSLQLISGDRIIEPEKVDKADEGFDCVDGVVVDECGRYRAFYVATRNRKTKRYAAADVVFWVFRRDHPDDVRGTPAFVPTFALLHHLERTIEAVVTAHRAAASLALLIKREGATEYAALLAQQQAAQGNRRRPPLQDLEHGTAQFLEPGESIEQVQGTQPHAQFEALCRRIMRLIAMVDRIPLCQLDMDFDAGSFSSAIAALQQAKKAFSPIWDELIYGPLRIIWEWRIAKWIVAGQLKASPEVEALIQAAMGLPEAESALAAAIAAVTEAPDADMTATPPAWGYLSVVDEIQGDLMLMDANVLTFEDICDKLGLDPKTQGRKAKKWIEFFRALGITQAKSQATRDPAAVAAEAAAAATRRQTRPRGKISAAKVTGEPVPGRIRAGASGTASITEGGALDVVVYTGAPIYLVCAAPDGKPCGRTIIDLTGIAFEAERPYPVLWHHDDDKPVGVSDRLTLSDGALRLVGRYDQAVEAGVPNLAKLARLKYPLQASIGLMIRDFRRLTAGETEVVNGVEVTGPICIVDTSDYTETSLLTFGADGNTQALLLEPKEMPTAAELAAAKAAKSKIPAKPAAQAAAAQPSAIKAAISAADAKELSDFMAGYPGQESAVVSMLADGKDYEEVAAALDAVNGTTEVEPAADAPVPPAAGSPAAAAAAAKKPAGRLAAGKKPGSIKAGSVETAVLADLNKRYPGQLDVILELLEQGKSPDEVGQTLDLVNKASGKAAPAAEALAAANAEIARLKAGQAGAQPAGRVGAGGGNATAAGTAEQPKHKRLAAAIAAGRARGTGVFSELYPRQK